MSDKILSMEFTKIYLTNHKSPDLDAVVSAVAYADFLTQSEKYPGAEIIPTIAGEPNKETVSIFNKFGVEMPESLNDVSIDSTSAFILMDHNEESQRHEKVINDQVIEIVDHHKLNVNFNKPLYVDVRPVGSTSTVVYSLYEINNLKAPKEVLSLILSAILSDTQGLKSSTTTQIDREFAEKISKELDLDIEELTLEIFKAKSDLTGLSPEEIATKDYKIFEFGGHKVFIGQVETVEPEKVLEHVDVIVEALDGLKVELGADHTFLVITDIIKANSHIIYTNSIEKNVAEIAFAVTGNENYADIGPRTSRKKDIAPEIEKACKKF